MDEDNLLNGDLYVYKNGTYEKFEGIKAKALNYDLIEQIERALNIDSGAGTIMNETRETAYASFTCILPGIKRFVKLSLLPICPNRRVVWLALHHMKERVRKKNLNRAMKIISKQKNTKRGDI